MYGRTTFCLLLAVAIVNCQINLGTLNLNPNPDGGIDFGFNQMANIFGFGGDRGLQFQTGRHGFNARSTGGAIIGNERVGIDSGLGVGEGRGVNLGSMLQLGNRPSVNPLGDLINNVGGFFNNLVPARVTPVPYSPTGIIDPDIDSPTPRPSGTRSRSKSWESDGDEEEVPLRITTEGRRGGGGGRSAEMRSGRNSAETGELAKGKKSNKPPVPTGLLSMDGKEETVKKP